MNELQQGPSTNGMAAADQRITSGSVHAVPIEKAVVQGGKHAITTRWIKRIAAALVALVILGMVLRWVLSSLNTVSTDDAYVSGHVTFVAARVPGQVARVFVDDNNRVRRGDVLLQLDREPYEVQLNIARSQVVTAQADLVAVQAQARGIEGEMRSLRFALERAAEDVDNQVALLHSKVATLQSQKATLAKAQANYDRAVPLVKSGAVSQEDFDTRTEALMVARSQVEEALQSVYQVRVELGLSPKPLSGDDLSEVPADLDQTFSSVRQAQASLIQAMATIGVTESFVKPPKQMLADFQNRHPSGDPDRILASLLLDAPTIKQAESKLAETKRNLDQAELNLRYCDVIAEIDGVVTRAMSIPATML